MALGDIVKHPRRLGFLVFNLIAAGIVLVWLGTRTESAEAGLAGVPNLALSTVIITIVIAVWIGSWLAWGWLVWSRRQKRLRQT
jgi:hypothetical protein